MLAFPGMLLGAADAAGIPIPDPDVVNADRFELESIKEDFTKYFIFCILQLGKSMAYASEHWDNAKVIAAIPENELKTITPAELGKRGFSF